MAYTGLIVEPKLIKESKHISIFDYGKSIYEIVFHSGSLESVDEWMAEVALINAQYKPKEVVHYIVNTAQMGNEQIPIMYVFRRSQEYVRDHPARPITRTLIFHAPVDNTAMLPILNIFTSWLSNHRQETALFLPITREAEGMAWLFGG